MRSLSNKSNKPHAVFLPFPTQGHITPLLKLAKLFYHRGFVVTFVNTDYNHMRMLKSKGSNVANQLPDFRFETMRDGQLDAPQDIASLCHFTSKCCPRLFQELVVELNQSPDSTIPPISCIIADGKMSFALLSAEQLGIPCVLFWTFAACGFMSLKLCKDLKDMGVTPFKDSSYLNDGTLDTPVQWIPGLKDIRLRDIASFIQTTDPNDIFLEFIDEQLRAISKASGVILYTFDSLESNMLDILSPFLPPIYTIGPLQPIVDRIPDTGSKFLDCSLLKAEEGCLQWLDSKEPNSVIYINFGTIAVLTPDEVLELAWGLANSKKNFFWIIRHDLIKGDSGTLSTDFLSQTKERGLIASWCPQEKVLNHPSVGGFLTHCGWNSAIEGITAGVPFLCMPCISEQFTNSKFLCKNWGIGIEVLKSSRRDEIARAIGKLMDEEKGKEMKKRAVEWKAQVEEATASPKGSSYLNLEKLIEQVMQPSK